MLLLVLLALQTPAQLTRQIEFYNPDWSPDGQTLLFESTLGGKFAIYTIKVDGSGLRRLTVDTANNEQPRWSHDGRRIVFSSDRAGHGDLYVMNADGSGQTRLTTTTSGGYYQSSFSPDGNWILFQGRPDFRETRDRVYLIRSDGSGWRRLSDSAYGAEGPRWTPDGSITFKQVPYPKRFWNEMTPADMDSAKHNTRVMTVRPDGSGLRAVSNQAGEDDHKVRSPNGRQFAYTKSVDGASGLYVDERLLIGGRGVGPLGYLRTATLTPLRDTLDTYESPHEGPIVRGAGAYVVREIRPVRGHRWDLVDTWYDSTGRETARQYARTASAALSTELETVRAPNDSASMLVTADRVTAWVVPQGSAPRLYDSAAIGERYDLVVVASAIAKTHPAAGSVFLYPAHTLYGGSPVQTYVDSLRVVRRDTLYSGQVPLPVLVLERSSGGEIWADETTGAEVLSRGNAGPARWWWHIRRGVTPPRVRN
jgi:WD40 repeat protein